MATNQANVALLTQDPNLVPQAVTQLAGGGPTSQRPTSPATWFHYYDIDLGKDVIWNGSIWIPTSNGPQGPQGPQGHQGPAALFGPTLMRPLNPAPFQRYFDTDINSEIWWERGAWRTVAGTVGDVKIVQAASSAASITNNPGWVAEANYPASKQEAYFIPPESVPEIVYTGGPGGAWQGYDLTAYLNSVGLNGCVAAILQLRAEINSVGFGGPVAYYCTLSVASIPNSGGAISANAMATRDDSNASGSDQNLAYVPIIEGNNFYYVLNWGSVPTPRGRIWLTGFIYNPLVHPVSITSFAIRKT